MTTRPLGPLPEIPREVDDRPAPAMLAGRAGWRGHLTRSAGHGTAERMPVPARATGADATRRGTVPPARWQAVLNRFRFSGRRRRPRMRRRPPGTDASSPSSKKQRDHLVDRHPLGAFRPPGSGPSVPSSTASTSMVALSVSISAITSPAVTLVTFFLDEPARERPLGHGRRQLAGMSDLDRSSRVSPESALRDPGYRRALHRRGDRRPICGSDQHASRLAA